MKIIGDPEPEVEWYKDGKVIKVKKYDSRVKTTWDMKTDTYTLEVKDSTAEDAGEYSIKAVNDHGSFDYKIDVDVGKTLKSRRVAAFEMKESLEIPGKSQVKYVEEPVSADLVLGTKEEKETLGGVTKKEFSSISLVPLVHEAEVSKEVIVEHSKEPKQEIPKKIEPGTIGVTKKIEFEKVKESEPMKEEAAIKPIAGLKKEIVSTEAMARQGESLPEKSEPKQPAKPAELVETKIPVQQGPLLADVLKIDFAGEQIAETSFASPVEEGKILRNPHLPNITGMSENIDDDVGSSIKLSCVVSGQRNLIPLLLV